MSDSSGLRPSSHPTQLGYSMIHPSIRRIADVNTVGVKMWVAPIDHETTASGPTPPPRSHHYLRTARVVPLPQPHPDGSQDQHPPVHLSALHGLFAGSLAFAKSPTSKR